jgi:hypothetical protein
LNLLLGKKEVVHKMTDTTRLNTIQNAFTSILTTIGTDGANEAQTTFDSLNVTTKELLALANKPQVLPPDFDPQPFLMFPSDDFWEDQQRNQREVDELEQTATFRNDHPCYTCGTQCVPEQIQDMTYWFCEACYYGDEDDCGETGLDWNDSGYFD